MKKMVSLASDEFFSLLNNYIIEYSCVLYEFENSIQ